MNAIRMLWIAPSGTGKTYSFTQWMLQQIKNKWVSPRNIVLFAYNFKSDPSIEPLLKKCSRTVKNFEKTHCFKEIDEDLLNMLFASQENIKDTQDRLPPHYCVIFDDQVTSDVISRKRSSLTKFLTMGRHCNISCIFMLQKYSGTISPILRENMNVVCVGNLSGQDQIENVLRNYSAHLADNKRDALRVLMVWYNEAVLCNDNKGFLIIHCYTPFKQGRFEKCIGSGYFFDVHGQIPDLQQLKNATKKPVKKKPVKKELENVKPTNRRGKQQPK